MIIYARTESELRAAFAAAPSARVHVDQTIVLVAPLELTDRAHLEMEHGAWLVAGAPMPHMLRVVGVSPRSRGGLVLRGVRLDGAQRVGGGVVFSGVAGVGVAEISHLRVLGVRGTGIEIDQCISLALRGAWVCAGGDGVIVRDSNDARLSDAIVTGCGGSGVRVIAQTTSGSPVYLEHATLEACAGHGLRVEGPRVVVRGVYAEGNRAGQLWAMSPCWIEGGDLRGIRDAQGQPYGPGVEVAATGDVSLSRVWHQATSPVVAQGGVLRHHECIIPTGGAAPRMGAP